MHKPKKKSNKFNDDNIRRLVRHELFAGSNRLEAFRNVAHKLGNFPEAIKFTETSTEFVENLPKLQNKSELSTKQRKILVFINEDYSKASRGIEARKCQFNCVQCKFQLISSRYAVDGKRWEVRDPQHKVTKFAQLILFDNVYGEGKEIQIDGYRNQSIPKSQYTLHALNTGYFLLSTSNIRNGNLRVFLLKLDILCGTARVVNMMIQKISCRPIIVSDAGNLQRVAFLFRSSNRSILNINVMELAQSKMDFVASYSGTFNSFDVKSVWMKGNSIRFLSPLTTDGRRFQHVNATFTFNEYILESGQVKCVELCRIPNDGVVTVYCGYEVNYAWFNQNTCYILFAKRCFPPLSIFKFDLTLQRMIRVNLPVPEYIHHFVVDENEVLCCYSKEYRLCQHVYSRFPTRVPDKLEMLAMFGVRKQAFLMNNEEYKLFIGTCPLAFRPFGSTR